MLRWRGAASAASIVAAEQEVVLRGRFLQKLCPRRLFLPTHLPRRAAPWPPTRQGAQSRARGGAFALLNGAAARDALVVHLPANVTLAAPIHILHLSSAAAAAAAGQASLAAPRLLAVLEEGASAEIVEEFASLAAPPAGSASKDAPVASLTTAVAEIELDDRAALKHSYVVLEGAAAAHAKATLVNQVGAAWWSMWVLPGQPGGRRQQGLLPQWAGLWGEGGGLYCSWAAPWSTRWVDAAEACLRGGFSVCCS